MSGELVAAVSGVALACVALVRAAWMKTLAQRAAREIAERAAEDRRWGSVVQTQREIVVELRNHMTDDREALQKISEHMGATVEAIRGLQLAFVTREKK